MAVELISLKAQRTDQESVDIFWEIDFNDVTPSDVRIDIYRSQSPSPDIEDYELLQENVNPLLLF